MMTGNPSAEKPASPCDDTASSTSSSLRSWRIFSMRAFMLDSILGQIRNLCLFLSFRRSTCKQVLFRRAITIMDLRGRAIIVRHGRSAHVNACVEAQGTVLRNLQLRLHLPLSARAYGG